MPGRSVDARPPDESELNVTQVLTLGLDEVSAKVRQDGPFDKQKDLKRDVWAGEIPLSISCGMPVPAETSLHTKVPDYIKSYLRKMT